MQSTLNSVPGQLVALKEAWKCDRRTFLSRALALGFGTAAFSFASKAWAEPRKGGTLRIATTGGATVDSFDPHVFIYTYHITLAMTGMYDRLIDVDLAGAPAPMLAESWSASENGLIWRFKLRQGVLFQSSLALTAEDVVASYRYVTAEDSKYSEPRQILSSVKDVKADGDTVVFELSSADSDLPLKLSHHALMVAPADMGKDGWGKPGNGTGPYVLKTFEPGVKISLSKNPHYYRDDDGFFDAVEIMNVPDTAARISALQAGDVDFISNVEPKLADRIKSTPGVELIEAKGLQHYTMPMNTTMAPYDNVDVRLAVKYAIKREEMLQKILSGYGYIGNDHPIGKNQQFFNTDLPQREYDPEKAKFHLKKAGYDRLPVELFTADAAFAGAIDSALLFAESAAPAGIDVKVTRVPDDGYWADTWRQKPFIFGYWSGRMTADWMFNTAFVSTSTWNEAYWTNERFDKILAEARGEADTDKRREMYWELQSITRDDGGVPVPLFASHLHAASDKLGHNEFRGAYGLDNISMLRTTWFKA